MSLFYKIAILILVAIAVGCAHREPKQADVRLGHAVPLAQFPYVGKIVKLTEKGVKTLCSASIVGPRKLVTAAHCIYKYRNTPRRLAFVAETRQSRLARVYIHPYFSRHLQEEGNPEFIFSVDLAVVELASRLAPPYARLYYGSVRRGEKLKAVGFRYGRNRTKVTGEVKLHRRMRARLPSLGMAQFTLPGAILVATYADINRPENICEGQSGGPLVMKKNGREVVVGVASGINYPEACRGLMGADRGDESYHVRLGAHAKWIENSVKTRVLE